MNPRTTAETAMICAASVTAITVATLFTPDAKGLLWMAGVAVIAIPVAMAYRYLNIRKQAQIELSGGEQYRKLAEEYRRLTDLAITAQEHTDLKLGDVSAHLDYVREQIDSLQRILREVE